MERERTVGQSQWISIFECPLALAFPLTLPSPRGARENLGDPIGEEDVVFIFGGGIAIGGPYQLFSIRREHGEAIKVPIERNLFRLCAIVSNHMEIERWTTLMIGRCGEIR